MLNRKKVWLILAKVMVLGFAVIGVGKVFSLPTPDTGAFYVVVGCGFLSALLLIYEYHKARLHNDRIRDVLKDVLSDNDQAYQYERKDTSTAFYLSAEEVIRCIESDRERLTPQFLRKIADKYKDSPKISQFLKIKYGV